MTRTTHSAISVGCTMGCAKPLVLFDVTEMLLLPLIAGVWLPTEPLVKGTVSGAEDAMAVPVHPVLLNGMLPPAVTVIDCAALTDVMLGI